MSLPIVDAVTAIFVCDDEIFMTRRHPEMVSFPGYQAFPGGKVDTGDDAGSDFADPMLTAHDPRLMRALVRELAEELEFDLPAAVASGQVNAIQMCARALTPTAFPRRFDTWFYLLRVRDKPAFVVDAREAVESAWATPAAWLGGWHRGEMIVAPPTLACLEALVADLNQPRVRPMVAVPHDPTTPAEGRLTVIENLRGLHQIFVRSNTLPPAEHTNCFVFGDPGSPRVAVDPSPRDATECARLEQALLSLGVDQVLITHHHRDHNQFADELARRHGWPVRMSAITDARLRARGSGFFDRLQLIGIEDGQELTRWQGQAVRALAVPGHDDGQIALMPDQRNWCIVGDLIQGVGTVVISKPEGNMSRYFESMQRIIDLAPRFIFPSHGIGMGTTFRLEETLRHRHLREAEVLKLQVAGLGVEQMLKLIYKDLDPRLLPLAQRNIESHIDKLREEGRLPIQWMSP